jgi:hypothetical protein
MAPNNAARSHGPRHFFQDTSSEFLPDRELLPRTGSYVIEKFMHTGGTDIKVAK